MKFSWMDYALEDTVESWIDEETKSLTGLSEGFHAFFDYWKDNEEQDSMYNENFWCKIISKDEQPLAVIAFGLWDDSINIMELILMQCDRNKGYGPQIIQELLDESQWICGYPIFRANTSILEHNIPAQKAFKKVGFKFQYADEDLGIWHYTYIKQ